MRIVVLPFDDLGSRREDAFLAAGIAREVRDHLSRVGGLRVIAEQSSRSVAAEGLSPAAAVARLGVDWLIRGSVRQANGKVRVAIEMLEGAEGAIAWSFATEGIAADPFALQDAVAGAALREILGRIGAEQIGEPTTSPLRDSRAYRLVLEARQLLELSRSARMSGREAEGLDAADRASALAGRALGIDSRDVGALLVMAELTRNGWTRSMAAQPLTADQRVRASITFVTSALAVDPNDAAALTALGDYYRRFAWRWQEAETLFRKALALNPSLPEAHWSYAYLLGVLGRGVEGLAHAQILFGLDPETTWRRVALPRLLYIVGDRGRAMQRYAVELRTTPHNVFLISEIYLTLLIERNAAGLRNFAERVRRLQPPGPIAPALAAMITRIGNAADALEGRPAALLAQADADVAAFDSPGETGIASRLGRASIDYLYIYAIEYGWAGQPARAAALLERALAGHSLYWPVTIPFGTIPFPPAVQRDPRWASVWQSSPALRDLLASRRAAALRGQQSAVLENGTRTRVDPAAITQALAAV